MTTAPEQAAIGEPTSTLRGIFDAAEVEGFVHVRDIDGDAEFSFQGEAPVVLASVFKIPIVLEYARQAAAGTLDRAARHLITDADREGDGVGTDGCRDDVELSARDVAFMMMSMSDNAATDVLLRLVGHDNVRATLDALDCRRTRISSCRELLGQVWSELGIDVAGDLQAQLAKVTPERLRALSHRDPERTASSTPREITKLLAAIWRDEAGSAEACAEVREIMGRQIWPHRLSSGFEDGIKVAGKTGTLWGVRNEAGVVEYPDGKRYAVGVFLRSDSMANRLPKADASIGLAARAAIEHLRA
ncbi:serine hydrolase [Embleya sp. NBC_00896]|uniref:serine hydrolase n=1 Tax=Embleya sp. NBC_00896 TaxID=2975961 RepID=UPI002F9188C0|nr:class A beta-lactamase-related serine hydrolase [Embleya sp. NBC_00896]